MGAVPHHLETGWRRALPGHCSRTSFESIRLGWLSRLRESRQTRRIRAAGLVQKHCFNRKFLRHAQTEPEENGGSAISCVRKKGTLTYRRAPT